MSGISKNVLLGNDSGGYVPQHHKSNALLNGDISIKTIKIKGNPAVVYKSNGQQVKQTIDETKVHSIVIGNNKVKLIPRQAPKNLTPTQQAFWQQGFSIKTMQVEYKNDNSLFNALSKLVTKEPERTKKHEIFHYDGFSFVLIKYPDKNKYMPLLFTINPNAEVSAVDITKALEKELKKVVH